MGHNIVCAASITLITNTTEKTFFFYNFVTKNLGLNPY